MHVFFLQIVDWMDSVPRGGDPRLILGETISLQLFKAFVLLCFLSILFLFLPLPLPLRISSSPETVRIISPHVQVCGECVAKGTKCFGQSFSNALSIPSKLLFDVMYRFTAWQELTAPAQQPSHVSCSLQVKHPFDMISRYIMSSARISFMKLGANSLLLNLYLFFFLPYVPTMRSDMDVNEALAAAKLIRPIIDPIGNLFECLTVLKAAIKKENIKSSLSNAMPLSREGEGNSKSSALPAALPPLTITRQRSNRTLGGSGFPPLSRTPSRQSLSTDDPSDASLPSARNYLPTIQQAVQLFEGMGGTAGQGTGTGATAGVRRTPNANARSRRHSITPVNPSSGVMGFSPGAGGGGSRRGLSGAQTNAMTDTDAAIANYVMFKPTRQKLKRNQSTKW